MTVDALDSALVSIELICKFPCLKESRRETERLWAIRRARADSGTLLRGTA